MATVTVLGPGGYPRPPYGSFAGKPAAAGDSKSYTQQFSVLGPGGYPRPPYASFSGKQPAKAAAGLHAPHFFSTMGMCIGSPANPPS